MGVRPHHRARRNAGTIAGASRRVGTPPLTIVLAIALPALFASLVLLALLR